MYQLSQQKKVIAVSLVAVIVLSVITIANNPKFIYQTPTVDNAKQQAKFEQALAKGRAEYQEYLRSIEADPETSKLLLSELIQEEDVKRVVEGEFNVNQPLELPTVDDGKLSVVSNASSAEVKDYFSSHLTAKRDFTEQMLGTSWNLYKDGYSVAEIEDGRKRVKQYVDSLYKTPVPEQAVAYHKDIIVLEEGYARQIDLALEYRRDGFAPIISRGYKEWYIADEVARDLRKEVRALDEKFAITEIQKQVYGDFEQKNQSFLAKIKLVNEAQAFGFGFSFNVEVGNIVEEIKDAIGGALARAQAYIIDIFIGKIEKLYAITNYLYYADALVAGRLVPDILDKYVPDTLDQDIIKSFIPQFNCGGADLQKINKLAKQKSSEYLGFDPVSLDVSQTDFYERAQRTGHLLSRETGVVVDGISKALETVASAQQEISRELLGTGKKAGLDEEGRGIELSVAGVQNTQQALLIGQMNLGTIVVRVSVASIVRTVMTTLLNTFLFSRAKTVLKEQDRQACLTGVQLQPLVPVDIPDPGPEKFTEEYIKKCRQNPEACLKDLDQPTPPPPPGGLPPPSDQSTSKLQMDKDAYLVGEVPRFRLKGTGQPAGTRIQWKTELISAGSGGSVSGNIVYEDQVIDANGDWPGGEQFSPYDKQFGCADRGTWKKTATVGSQEFSFTYTVKENPAKLCS